MKRNAVTLIEIVLALSICTAAILVMQRSGTGSVVPTQRAAAMSRELAAALRVARETAIGSGRATRLRFITASAPTSFSHGSPSRISTVGFVVERSDDGVNYVALADRTEFPATLAGQANVTTITFEPTGDADASLEHMFSIAGRTFVVSVDRVGGRTHYAQ